MATPSIFTFSDVNSSLNLDISGNPVILYDQDCINQSITTILSTIKGERMMLPDFGCSLPLYVFEPLDALTANILQTEIKNAITNWEGRVKLVSVAVQPVYEANAYNITIVYTMGGTGAVGQFNASLPVQGQ